MTAYQIYQLWDMQPVEDFFATASHTPRGLTNFPTYGIYMMGDFAHYSRAELQTIPQIGERAVDIIERHLHRHGSKLQYVGQFEPTEAEALQYARDNKLFVNKQRGEHDTDTAFQILTRAAMQAHARQKPWCYGGKP